VGAGRIIHYLSTGCSATQLATPSDALPDSQGGLWISNTRGDRVLYYPAGSATPTRVYGQGSFTSCTYNQGQTGPTAATLYQPSQLALDFAGNLYVADVGNSRVLMYSAGAVAIGASATRVFGQSNSFTTMGAPAASATVLNGPFGVLVDWADNVYISDTGDNRMLFYSPGSTTATAVFGQGGSFTSSSANNGGGTTPSASSLSNPRACSLDAHGNLLVTDNYNNRVLVIPPFTTPSAVAPAIRVLGQT